MSKQACRLILSRTKFVLILFMVLMPLTAYISWLAAELPRINRGVYYTNLLSVFSYPFITIIVLRYSAQYYENNQYVKAVALSLIPLLNIIITIICFNYMQYSP